MWGKEVLFGDSWHVFQMGWGIPHQSGRLCGRGQSLDHRNHPKVGNPKEIVQWQWFTFCEPSHPTVVQVCRNWSTQPLCVPPSEWWGSGEGEWYSKEQTGQSSCGYRYVMAKGLATGPPGHEGTHQSKGRSVPLWSPNGTADANGDRCTTQQQLEHRIFSSRHDWLLC